MNKVQAKYWQQCVDPVLRMFSADIELFYKSPPTTKEELQNLVSVLGYHASMVKEVSDRFNDLATVE